MCFSYSSVLSHYVFCSSSFLSIHRLTFFAFLYFFLVWLMLGKGDELGIFHLRRTKRCPFFDE
jgi:hypothetical protein